MAHSTIQTSREKGLEDLDPDGLKTNPATVAHARDRPLLMRRGLSTSLKTESITKYSLLHSLYNTSQTYNPAITSRGFAEGAVIKPRRFEMGVRLAERAAGIQPEMSLGAAIIPSPQKPFKKTYLIL
jgi:hypothetical protein